MPTIERFSSTGNREIEDRTLDAWDSLDAAGSLLEGPNAFGRIQRGATRGDPGAGVERPPNARPVPPLESGDPFDVAVAQPRAIDVRRLYKLLRREAPSGIEAALGPKIPVLLCHGMTPFYKPGQNPTGVWGMGYEAHLTGVPAVSVSLQPESRKFDFGKASQSAVMGLDLGGTMGIPDDGLKALGPVPGLSISGARIQMTSHQTYRLLLECTFSALEVQAGPIEGGGAKWNLYRGRERIDSYQPFFHTILVPKGTHKLHLRVETWIRRGGRFFGLIKPRHWEYPAREFEVSLE